MNLQWIGAVLIIAGCGGVGFGMALNYKQEALCLRQLLQVLEMFSCELEYRLTTLPVLFRIAANTASGALARVLSAVAQELESQIAPDAACCMTAALRNAKDLPAKAVFALDDLGRSLGEYDLDGQLKGIAAVTASCREQLEEMECNRTQRIRSYQTLALCAGAALAILLL